MVLAASSAAGTAVYKVMFKKVMGEVNFLEVSIFFSVSNSNILELIFVKVERIQYRYFASLRAL